MEQNIKFSITVPVFKARFLAECIDSILAQTYQNFELILVDDASPENIEAIISRYKDERIRYYRNSTGFGAKHVVGNWNKCLEYVHGDYVICMGDDDKLLSNCLESYTKLIKSHPGLNVYHGRTIMIDEMGKIVDAQEPRPIEESVYSMLYYRWFGNRSQFIGDWLFRTDALKKTGGFVDIPYAWEADDCSVANVCTGLKIANSQEPIFLYRMNRSSISTNYNDTEEKLFAHLKVLEIYKKILSKKPKDPLETFYYDSLINRANEHIAKNFGFDIGKDILHNPLRLFYWLSKRKKYSIPKAAIPRAIAYAIALHRRG